VAFATQGHETSFDQSGEIPVEEGLTTGAGVAKPFSVPKGANYTDALGELIWRQMRDRDTKNKKREKNVDSPRRVVAVPVRRAYMTEIQEELSRSHPQMYTRKKSEHWGNTATKETPIGTVGALNTRAAVPRKIRTIGYSAT
jgi:hypothetical protein